MTNILTVLLAQLLFQSSSGILPRHATAFVPSQQRSYLRPSYATHTSRTQIHSPGRSLKLVPPARISLVGTAQQTDTLVAVNDKKDNPFQWLSDGTDVISGFLFSALHSMDTEVVRDNAKNLRVLWIRALLAANGRLDDPVAYELLPPQTRDLVKTRGLFDGILPYADWIRDRSNFIDKSLDAFAASPASRAAGCQVVVLGAGFDTRSLRYQGKGIDFFELDLPEVVEDKKRVHNRYQKQQAGDIQLPTIIPFDLNDVPTICLLDILRVEGWDASRPSMFVSEAVLFYVDKQATESIFDELFTHCANRDDSIVTIADSLKPVVSTPFLADVRRMLDPYKLDILDHFSMWGGAIHYITIAPPVCALHDHLSGVLEKPINSYAPVVLPSTLLSYPSFKDCWYAVATVDMVPEDEIYPTRLWGEPLVIFRDTVGRVVCLQDLCPHRSAPLSMGELKNGELKCFYHGWAFTTNGRCSSIPTAQMSGDQNQKVLDRSCANHYSVVEDDGLIWVWNGDPLMADMSKLPKPRSGEMETLNCDTVLDYKVDWCYIVENNLDSPHLYWLHDGSIPPLESLGFARKSIHKMDLKSFQDDCGVGHIGKTGSKGTTKIIRFDPPNIVRHCGVSGFHEEFHIIPVAPGRTRVLLRQRFPKGPILSTLTALPGLFPAFDTLVKFWNYQIGLEDYSVMQGQQHNVEDLGARRVGMSGLGDDLIVKFYKWRETAIKREGQPYFNKWRRNGKEKTVMLQAVESYKYMTKDDGLDDGLEGTYGLKKSYLLQHPAPSQPPANVKAGIIDFRKTMEVIKALEKLKEGTLEPRKMVVLASIPLLVLASQKVPSMATEQTFFLALQTQLLAMLQ